MCQNPLSCDNYNFPFDQIGQPTDGNCWNVYGYDDARWFAEQLSPECQAAWWEYYFCDVRNLHDGNGFLQIPGILPIQYPDNCENFEPVPGSNPPVPLNIGPLASTGYFLLNDNQHLIDAVNEMFEYKKPTLAVEETCTEVHCNFECNGNIAPSGFIYEVGLTAYTFTIRNTDCSSIYTLHIRRPDGTWVKHNWQQRTSWTYYPLVSGEYTIYIRQDNPDAGSSGVFQEAHAMFLEGKCCNKVPVKDCHDKIVKDIDITCIKENEESIEYNYIIDLTQDVSFTVTGVKSISEETTIETFDVTNPHQVTGKFKYHKK